MHDLNQTEMMNYNESGPAVLYITYLSKTKALAYLKGLLAQ